jgi:hypothetical protein
MAVGISFLAQTFGGNIQIIPGPLRFLVAEHSTLEKLL